MFQLGQMVVDKCGRYLTVKRIDGDLVTTNCARRYNASDLRVANFASQYPREAREESAMLY